MTIQWIPLESNPDVFNGWASKAGLDIEKDQFSDILGLDPELLALVPQPVKAVILIYPTPEYQDRLEKEDKMIRENGQPPIDPSIIWIKQTISNACGTMAILHSLANSDVAINPGTPLAEFFERCTDITALQRSQLLEKSDLFSSIHAGAAQGGQTAAPSANVEPPFAYTCFVQARAPPSFRNGEHRLLELNGARDGPIDRGTCNNLLEDVAEYVRETHVNHNLNPKISMLALGPSI